MLGKCGAAATPCPSLATRTSLSSVKKVIDAGALRSRRLVEFLSSSPSHIAVLTDYASMESFKGEGAINIRKSIEILARFPKQVVILKSTATISRLRPRMTGLHSRFLDRKQTAGFPRYCSALLTGGADPRDVAYDIEWKEGLSREHFSRLQDKTATIGEAWTALFKSYGKADLKKPAEPADNLSGFFTPHHPRCYDSHGS